VNRRGIILAGGAGTRLHPLTLAVSKQLLPVYDKPMIYYPLSVLMLAGVREILIITTPEDQPAFQRLLGDGAQLGLKLSYLEQSKPNGLPEAYVLGEAFLAGEPSLMVLGDNIFFGHLFAQTLQKVARQKRGATVFGYQVGDPERYGVMEFDASGRIVGIAEKPKKPKSHIVVTGLYVFDGRASQFARSLKASARGETEITHLIQRYLDAGELAVERMGRGLAWLDTGTHDSMVQASEFVRAIEARQGLKIGCVEEVAYRMGYIEAAELRALAAARPNSPYYRYLGDLADDPDVAASRPPGAG
jgi:glucose-1-phosphate thymidylyltransferase